jgi:glycosyltransferase involved in cell wall biosynthesis
MRKVLHIINGDLYAGAERVQDLLALNLPRFDYDVGLVTLKGGLYPSARQARDAPLFPAGMRSRLDLRVVPGIANIAREGGYQIMHTHSPRSALIGALASSLAAVPLVHHLHGPTTHDTEHVFRNYWNSFVERICVKKAAHTVAVSRHVAGYARSLGVPAARSTIVWNGVETAPELPARNNQGQPTVGAVALFRPRKGVEVLVEAAAQLADIRSGPFKLLMVGGFESTAYENKIKELARRLSIEDRIEWTGFTTDVKQMLGRMDVFVLPSLYGEGMPMVVLEAMALGLPIVATAVGGVVEAIEDRRQGILVEPGDASAMCASLNEVLDSEKLRLEIGKGARHRQIERFTADTMAAGVAAVYDRILGAG